MALPIALLLALLAVLALDAAPRADNGGDSAALVGGARAAAECIGDGTFVRCGYPGPPEGPTSMVLPYPVLQYLPAIAMIAVGLGDDGVLWGLVAVSLLAFAAALLLVARTGPSLPPGVGPILVAVTLLSPLLFYAVSPFGEMLSTTLLLAATVAALHRRPWVTAVAVALACLGKETLFPFVVVLVLVAARDERDRWLPPRTMTVAVLGGALAGASANAAFNVFRFGTPRNIVYLRSELRTDGLDNAISFLGAVWAGPAGGILWFWPAAALVVVAIALAGGAALLRGRDHWPAAAGPVACVLCVVVFTIGLAFWFAPYGWIAWGPRLALPILPAALVAGAWAGRDPIGRWSAAVVRPLAGAVMVALALTATAWPQLGVPWTQEEAIGATISPSAGCPAVTVLHVQSRPDEYYRCLRRAMWRLRPNGLTTASTGGGLPAGSARVIGAAAAFLLVLDARRRSR